MARLLRSFVLATFVAAAIAAAVNNNGAQDPAVADDVPGATLMPDKTVATYLQSTGEHKVLLAAAGTVVNLTETLATPATRYTVFAPTDNAFATLARRIAPEVNFDQSDTNAVVAVLEDAFAELRELPSAGFAEIRNLLMYHIIGQALSSIQLEAAGSVVTGQGDSLRFADGVIIDGDDSRGNVSASTRDVFVQNGWVNIIQEVLLPFNLDQALSDLAALAVPTDTPTQDPIVTTSAPVPSESAPAPSESAPAPSGSGPVPSPTGPVTVGGGEDLSGDASPSVEPSVEPSSDATDESGPACFPGSAMVRLADGTAIAMRDLAAGHAVQVGEDASKNSPVFLFTHKNSARKAVFYSLTTASGHAVSLTAGHYVYANGALVAAKGVRVGDVLRTVAGNSPVIAVRRVRGEGLYAPHTVHGDVVVDGVVVSGYSRAVHPKLAHALLAPLRALAKYVGVVEPLGGLLYDGADGVVPFLPKGSQRY